MNRPRIVVTQRIHGEVAGMLAAEGELIANPNPEPWSDAQLREYAALADALLVFMPDRIDDAFLSACPRLKVIAAALKGYDNFDLEACTRRGIWFTIVPDRLTRPTAELALALMLALARNVLPGDRHIRSGQFRGWRPTLYGRSLYGAAVGIVGYGNVGRALAHLLEPFQVRLWTYDVNDEQATLDRLLRESDFVVPLLPLTESTVHFFDAARLRWMRRGSLLVNVSRGSVVDEEAVTDALASGHLGGYAADTFEMEDWARPGRPNAIPPALLGSANTVFTPHLGSAVGEVRLEIERLAAMSVIQALRGQPPEGAVNRLSNEAK
jgi:phosphonate dehydrogenase